MDPYSRLKNRIFLAPMAGYTDRTMRKLCTEQGAGLTFTEMISAKALLYNNERTLGYVSFDGFKTGVQLFGSEPPVMAKAAEMLTERFGQSIEVFDVNMGCPAPKITGNGEGSALMLNPSLAARIVSAMKNSTTIPVTVKFRKGYDSEHVNAVQFAKILEDAGADALTVHGRTREQYYSGKSDADIIAEVKSAVGIPVIGNGDVFSPEDAEELLRRTGCDGVMVARGALGNPFIFSMIESYLSRGEYKKASDAERVDMAKRHIKMVCEDKGEYVGIRELRKHLCFYIKGMKGSARARERIVRAETMAEAFAVLDDIVLHCGT